jgi:hypothetical protein
MTSFLLTLFGCLPLLRSDEFGAFLLLRPRGSIPLFWTRGVRNRGDVRVHMLRELELPELGDVFEGIVTGNVHSGAGLMGVRYKHVDWSTSRQTLGLSSMKISCNCVGG